MNIKDTLSEIHYTQEHGYVHCKTTKGEKDFMNFVINYTVTGKRSTTYPSPETILKSRENVLERGDKIKEELLHTLNTERKTRLIPAYEEAWEKMEDFYRRIDPEKHRIIDKNLAIPIGQELGND